MKMPENPKVGIIHESPSTRRILKQALENRFIQTQSFPPEKVTSMFFEDLNAGLISEKALEAIELCQGTPYIILGQDKSREEHSESAVNFLENGARGYIPITENPDLIAFRTKAVLRRLTTQTDTKLIKAGEITLDIGGRAVLKNGQTIPLEKREFEVLLSLMQNQGKVVSSDDIMNDVWKDSDVYPANVTILVGKIRRKLGYDSIETARGIGYRFKAG